MKRVLSAILVLCFLVFCAYGCAGGPYRDALRRVGDVGPRIADDITPSDPGGEARKAEFLRLCDECRTLGEE